MSTSSYSASLRFRTASSTHFATSADFRFGRVLPVMIPTLSIMVSFRSGSAPQRSIGAELLADAANLRLPLAQRLGARVHRVVAEDEVMRMLRRRTENEPGVAFGDEVDRLPRRLEDRDLPAGNRRGRPEHPFMHRDPCDRVPSGRLVGP